MAPRCVPCAPTTPASPITNAGRETSRQHGVGFYFHFLVYVVVVIVYPIHLVLAPLEPRGINSTYCCSLDGAGRVSQNTWRWTTKHELILFLKNEGADATSQVP
jgi:hypothetical protein